MTADKVIRIIRVGIVVLSALMKAHYIWKKHKEFSRDDMGPPRRY